MKKPFSLHVDVDAFLPASEEDKAYMVQMRPSSTFFKDGVKRLLKNKVATVSLLAIVLITLASITLPFFWPYPMTSSWAWFPASRWTPPTTIWPPSPTARRSRR